MTRAKYLAPYPANHNRVRYVRGRACFQLCAAGCQRQAMDWALRHGEDGTDPDSYMPLCRSCHYFYDGEGQAKGKVTRSRNPAWIESRRTIPRDSRGRWSAP